MYNIFELNEKSLEDLKLIAIEMGIDDENKDRTQLVYDIIDHQVDHPDIKKTPNTAAKAKKTKNQKNEKAAKEIKATLMDMGIVEEKIRWQGNTYTKDDYYNNYYFPLLRKQN